MNNNHNRPTETGRPRTVLRSALLSLMSAFMVLVAACGGSSADFVAGVGSGGTGGTVSGSVIGPTVVPTQTANGTVTGFGSVFVDGVELQDADAATQTENADGSTTNVVLRLGQRVQVAHDGKGTASLITVHAAVIGAVGQINSATSEFKVAGQWVKPNADATAGPVTAYGGGYLAFADIAAGDLVEVHGSPAYSNSLAAYEVQATRIEKLKAITAVRVMDKLASLDASSKTFAINGLTVNYTGATLVPATLGLANDQTVIVWGAPGSLAGSGSALTLTASRVRILSGPRMGDIVSGTAQFGGVLNSYDAAARTFEIQGVRVSIGAASIAPTGASVANGSYVHVSGVFGADGSLAAQSIHVRELDTGDDTAKIRLSGVVSSFTDASSFVVRDIPVDASAIIAEAACPGITLTSGVYVQVIGHTQVGTDVIKADAMRCRAANLPPMAMRQMVGSAGSVDQAAKTFVLALPRGIAQSVKWRGQTVFTSITAAALSGATVHVDGYLDTNGVLMAREIRVPGSRDSDQYDSKTGGMGWARYASSFRPR